MCNPIAIGVMMAMSAAASVAQNQKTASAMARNAAEEMKIKNEARYQSEVETNQKAALDKLEVERATMRRIATARVSAGESGIGGNSVLREYMTGELQGLHDKGIVDTARENASEMAAIDAKAAQASYDSKITQAKSLAGNPIGNALKIGTAGVGGYTSAGGKF